MIGCSYGLQCYTTTNASKDVQSADSTLEVCESEAENCLTVVSKEKLRTLNPQLANETALPLPPLLQSHGSTNPNSSSALFDNISVLVTSSSIEHQGQSERRITEKIISTKITAMNQVEVHRAGKFLSGRTGLIEAGYRPDRTLSSIISNEGLFGELGNEDYEKRSRFLPQSGEKIHFFRCTYTFLS